MAGESWLADMETHLLAPFARMDRGEYTSKPTRPRECPACGAFSVVADTSTSNAVCRDCARVIQPEVWKSVREAAGLLGVSECTIQDWIVDGLPCRGKPRRVELGATREQRDVRAARSLMNLRSADSA